MVGYVIPITLWSTSPKQHQFTNLSDLATSPSGTYNRCLRDCLSHQLVDCICHAHGDRRTREFFTMPSQRGASPQFFERTVFTCCGYDGGLSSIPALCSWRRSRHWFARQLFWQCFRPRPNLDRSTCSWGGWRRPGRDSSTSAISLTPSGRARGIEVSRFY
jgi:hypothetical protein